MQTPTLTASHLVERCARPFHRLFRVVGHRHRISGSDPCRQDSFGALEQRQRWI